jgi:hypothetical protein
MHAWPGAGNLALLEEQDHIGAQCRTQPVSTVPDMCPGSYERIWLRSCSVIACLPELHQCLVALRGDQ